MLFAVWFVGTALATGFAFAAVSLVLAGVSEQGAEQLRLGSTSIYESAVLPASNPSTSTVRRTGVGAPTNAPAGPGQTAGSVSGRPVPGAGSATPPAASATTVVNPSSAVDGALPHEGPSSFGSTPSTTASTRSPAATFSATGGVVTVSCSGSSAQLVSASPTAGYRMDVAESGPEKVAVSFESSDRDVEIKVHCVNGRPLLEQD